MCQHCGCLNPDGPDLDYVCPNSGKRKERDSKWLVACECKTCKLTRGEEPKKEKPNNNCTTDKFTNCMGLWEPDKICKDTDCKYHKYYSDCIKSKRPKGGC